VSEKACVLTFTIAAELQGGPSASGRITGLQHASKVLSMIKEIGIDEVGLVVCLDFAGVELATASYLKTVVLGLTISGRLHAGAVDVLDLRAMEVGAFQPLNIYPVIIGANEEIQHELDEVFAGRKLPCVVGERPTKERLREGKIVGALDATATRTLRAAAGLQEFTAYDLQDRQPGEAVTATAWNNRLADLHKLRLMQRKRQGKFWKYQPVADSLTYG
jgi:hypothetical protein